MLHCTRILPYTPPFHWPNMLAFFQHRAIPEVEIVSGEAYQRTIRIDDICGWFAVSHLDNQPALQLEIHLQSSDRFQQQADEIERRVRRIMDLDAPMDEISRVLGQSPYLSKALTEHAGTRLPGCWDIFEFSIRAILGQQISVKAATTLAGRITHTYGNKVPEGFPEGLSYLFPDAATLAQQDFEGIGLTRSRKATLVNLAQRVAAGELLLNAEHGLDDFVRRIVKEPGIGPWTAHYLAMRGLSQSDAFPASDLGVLKGLADNDILPKPKQVEAIAEQWRPWRAYAAIYLWQSLS
ncbi:DNA-3-methyladenine glycosylase family protein [Parendozoicomonas haliclonae]|uniref:DNA-3-methyladenine glycosylase II n=1 Tax=Parendozoicomonas haliclonae TaxID=1960125 RepID=A0A1X7ARR4_9GAMM|nr:DNA-3-methyladenine glycosylase [Parendozoicomonas haliclonae]SMA50789.1 DNA-3-methyladenine glycosylase 2 [Parendozoicomonas haliclonae]